MNTLLHRQRTTTHCLFNRIINREQSEITNNTSPSLTDNNERICTPIILQGNADIADKPARYNSRTAI